METIETDSGKIGGIPCVCVYGLGLSPSLPLTVSLIDAAFDLLRVIESRQAVALIIL